MLEQNEELSPKQSFGQQQQQLRENDNKRSFSQLQDPQISATRQSLMTMFNQAQDTQRKRDIKQNYKAKLPLDKLIQEHEKKKLQIKELIDKRVLLVDKIKDTWEKIGQRQGLHVDFDMHLQLQGKIRQQIQLGLEEQEKNKNDADIATDSKSFFVDQTEAYKKNTGLGKTHWDFLIKEMIWMADDFGKETKKKVNDAKKMVRNCKKHLNEKLVNKEQQIREQKIQIKRKSKFMSNIVQMYWKSCEKIVKHNYQVEYERRRQQMKTKKLENFVQKHLKLSFKVAETLNTKQFVQQSLYKGDEDQAVNANTDGNILVDDGEKQIKIYDSQDPLQLSHIDEIKNSNQDEKQNLKAMTDEINGNQSLAEKTFEMAQIFQPTGYTLEKTLVNTKIPFLLRGSLREYQIIGMDWLVTLHNRKLNGILADEMGLGKTIQTIAMLASLACDKGIWGPHLIVVPTTIIMNWELEFKRWCPGFKILTYFGSQKERKVKRHGWSKDNSFHICITSYKLVIQDHFAFRRKKWYYMILDEAQNIKNFKSLRWQTLLKFNTKRRLLLTGTPLQNDVMELWSLMHFLMPKIFSNQQDFKEWFSNPFSQSINQNKSLNLRVVQKLQSILRPFLLRRMKREVEKQLPEKIEHIVQCNLSRRQRLLYDEYINHDKTRNILADSDFFSIMSVLMQLRKVCNHPDLFEARSIESPFVFSDQDRIKYSFPKFIVKELRNMSIEKDYDLQNLNFKLIENEKKLKINAQRQLELMPQRYLYETIYNNKAHLGSHQSLYEQNMISQNLMTHRPFQDFLAISEKHFTNNHALHKSNCSNLYKSIQNILPHDPGAEYKMQYHQIPEFLQAACLPFCQEYFSMQDYDMMRYSSFEQGAMNPVEQYKSAIQEEEQKQHLILLAKKLTIWHHIDRQNRLQILYSQPIFGEDLRQAINVTLVGQDVFEAKKFKYINWKMNGILKERKVQHDNSTNTESAYSYDQYCNKLYTLPQAVFNPVSPNEPRYNSTVVTNWPFIPDNEIDKLNQQNLFIKEVTQKTKEALRLKKEQKEREQKLNQLKKVQRNKQIQICYEETTFCIIIDLKGIKEQSYQNMEMDIANKFASLQSQEISKMSQSHLEDKRDNQEMEDQTDYGTEENNPNVQFLEEKQTKFKYQTKVYEEMITYKQLLMEQEEEKKQKGILTEDQNMQENNKIEERTIEVLKNEEEIQQKIIDNSIECEKQNICQESPIISSPLDRLLSISYKNSEAIQNMIISPMQRTIMMDEIVKNFKVIVPKCVAKPVEFIPTQVYTAHQKEQAYE